MDILIWVICWMTVTPGLPANRSSDRQEQPTSASMLNPQELQPVDAEQAHEAANDRSTAEELLEALRQHRPAETVIPPASASGQDSEPGGRALLPEGSAVVNSVGRLEREGRWWVFVFDSAEGEPPTKLLPNASCEVMVRSAAGSASPVKFAVSGEVTVFRGENYLLVEVARRSVQKEGQAAPQEGAPVDDRPPREEKPPAGTDEGKTVSTRLSVEDILAALQQQRPEDEIISAGQTGPNYRLERGATTARTLIPDGSPLMNRAGRLTHDGEWWAFAFESDHPDHPEPPMRLLPCKNVELMLQVAERGTDGLVFLVSGEVTAFEDENFLLPRVAMQRTDTGNLGR